MCCPLSLTFVRTFAFVGAVISNLSLLLGPFFQQSLEFHGKLVNDTSANAYASFASTYDPAVGFNDIARNPVSPFMKAAVYAGLLSAGAVTMPTSPFICPSSNCKWEPLHTLAVEADCRTAPHLFELIGCDNPSDFEPCKINAINEPDNRLTRFYKEGETPSKDNVFYFAEATVLAKEGSPYELDQSWQNSKGNRAEIDWIRFRNNSGETQITRNSTIEAWQCKIYTCLQKIQAEVQNGTYMETIEEITTEATEYTTLNGKTAYAYMYKLPNGTLSNVTVEQSKQQTLLDTISVPFEAMRVENQNSTYGWVSNGIVRRTTEGLDGTDILKTLYDAQNLTESVCNLVLHMNIALRSMHTLEEVRHKRADVDENKLSTDHDKNDEDQLREIFISPEERWKGESLVEILHVRARWSWLLLPGLLMTLTFVLLLATIVQTRGQKIGVWKENPLALLLFSKFDDKCKPTANSARTEKDIRMAAEGLDAQLTVSAEAGSPHVKDRILIQRRADV